MVNIPSTPTWSPDVYQIETTDAVLGGPNGVINVQAKQLADRTAYLKQEVETAGLTATQAKSKAELALTQIDTIEVASGSAADNAMAALTHKQGAQAAQALAEQARNEAQAAQAQAGDNAGFAYQAAQAAQAKSSESQAAATAATSAASAAGAARDSAIQAKNDTLAIKTAAVSDINAARDSGIAAVNAKKADVIATGDQKKSEITTLASGAMVDITAARDATLAAKTATDAQAAAAQASATTASTQSATATTQANAATTQAGLAATAKTAAEAARDAAQLSAGVYATTADGLAATTSGKYFSVPSASSSEYLILYQNSSGTAVEIKRYPSTTGLGAVLNGRFVGSDDELYMALSAPFAAGEKGFWFDVADPGAVFQDVGAASPVTASGQSVKRLKLNYATAPSGTNILPERDNFTNAGTWARSGILSVTANVDTGPGGALKADKIIESSGGTEHWLRYIVPSKQMGYDYRAVVVIKPFGRTKVRLGLGTADTVDVDLTTQAVIAKSGNIGNVLIESKANGYYSVTFDCIRTAYFDAGNYAYLWLLDATGASSYSGDGVSGIYADSFDVFTLSRSPLIQTNASKAPAYIEQGNLKMLRFDGVDDSMNALTVDMAGATKATIVMAFRQYTFNTVGGVVLEHGLGPFAGTGGITVFQNNGAPAGNIGAGMGIGSTYVINNGDPASAERIVIGTFVFDPAGETYDDQVRLRLNGVEVNESQISTNGTASMTAAFALRDLFIGGRNGTQNYARIDLFAGLVIGRQLSDFEIESIEKTLRLRTLGSTRDYYINRAVSNAIANPPTVSYTLKPVLFGENGGSSDQSQYFLTSTFATTEFQTEATSLTVTSYSTSYSTLPGFSAIGVYVNGVYNQTIAHTVSGSQSNTITLPAGNKLVTLVNGLQSRPNVAALPIGTWVTQVTSPVPITQMLLPRNRTLVYGDSISVGDASSPLMQKAWALQLRAAAYPSSVAVEGWGYRSLHEDANTAVLRKSFVKKLSQYDPDRIWLAIGTNDYGLAKWSAADFGAAYGAMLDDIHALMPSVRVYCQTPIVRSSEVANSFGNTLGDYRTQIATAVGTRTAYATLVDGTAFMTTASLSDGVHPNTAGHTLYADAVKAALGLA